jgi:hypothetical protein
MSGGRQGPGVFQNRSFGTIDPVWTGRLTGDSSGDARCGPVRCGRAISIGGSDGLHPCRQRNRNFRSRPRRARARKRRPHELGCAVPGKHRAPWCRPRRCGACSLCIGHGRIPFRVVTRAASRPATRDGVRVQHPPVRQQSTEQPGRDRVLAQAWTTAAPGATAASTASARKFTQGAGLYRWAELEFAMSCGRLW